MNKIKLDEGSHEFKAIKDEWRERAREATIESLPSFLRELSDDYSHDYGTICHAVAIAAEAAAWAMNHSPQGGITGFQAGAVTWEFLRSWQFHGNRTGLRIIDFDNFLYPQYADKFDKTLTREIWQAIQEAAKKEIAEADEEYAQYLIDIKQYKKDIAAFIAKYPDYPERKEYYEPLGMGTGAEWEAKEKKKKSGFEFAPIEPFKPVHGRPVYKHWQSIVSGVVPFGYRVEG